MKLSLEDEDELALEFDMGLLASILEAVEDGGSTNLYVGDLGKMPMGILSQHWTPWKCSQPTPTHAEILSTIAKAFVSAYFRRSYS